MAKVTINFKEGTQRERKKMIRDVEKRFDLHESVDSLVATMDDFESKYGMSTIEFYARFMAGKMGDSRDFIKWAGAFDTYQYLLQTHFHHRKAG